MRDSAIPSAGADGQNDEFGHGHLGIEELARHPGETSVSSWINRRKIWLEAWVSEVMNSGSS